ncbi:MAG: hypothetical protein EXS28_01470 [Pedosphaera sp.]|nr:hypothetical protein [Pedosphaera sp.]
MKCANARIEEGQVAFDCAQCGASVSADAAQVQQIWEAYEGSWPCGVCSQPVIVPTMEELAALELMPTLVAEETVAELPPDLPPDERVTEEFAAPAAIVTAVAKPPPVASARPGAAPAPRPQPVDPDAAVLKTGAQEGDIKLGFGGRKLVTLEQEQRGEKQITLKTIRHGDCVKDGKDKFDEAVTHFLREQGNENIISVTPVQCRADDKGGLDYGVVILYKA